MHGKGGQLPKSRAEPPPMRAGLGRSAVRFSGAGMLQKAKRGSSRGGGRLLPLTTTPRTSWFSFLL